MDALKANGSPKPEFETDEARTYFISRFYIHEGFKNELEKEPKKSQKGAEKRTRKKDGDTEASNGKSDNDAKAAHGSIKFNQKAGSNRKGYWIVIKREI